ncbi:SGNH hydrolase-type esterase domain containing protein [Parasponia andersonii]|uniref:SGNH hydrolase-type esterase domain containing protein n=1 Tax=Parasponia andersonii TaxID=3476 RepID=A0A2P5E5K6_PARAD|nr:SGNH hydrolase-type esterase domain containing protein [Parasponia andersonii]
MGDFNLEFYAGFLETKRPCCLVKVDSSGLCAPNDNPCRARNTTLFWDDSHLTEAANRLIVERCFSGSGVFEPNLRTSLSSKQPRLRPRSVHLLFLLTISRLFFNSLPHSRSFLLQSEVNYSY